LVRNDIPKLRDFVVSFKSDGTRVLVLIGPSVLLVNRAWKYSGALFATKDVFCVLDCELFTSENILVIFDAFIVNGVSTSEMTYCDRLDAVKWYLKTNKLFTIIERLYYGKGAVPSFFNDIWYKFHQYKVKVKQVFYVCNTYLLPAKWPHYRDDGLIFTSRQDVAYKCRVYKWKPCSQQTIDLCVSRSAEMFNLRPPLDKFQKGIQAGPTNLCMNNGKYLLSANMVADLPLKCEIVELMWDGYWIFKQERLNKTRGNGTKTVLSVLHAINENITRPELGKLLRG
jgi:hypothetical protein